MILKPATLRTAAALLLAVPVVTPALVPRTFLQASAGAQATDPRPMPTPQQFLLKCKIVRTDDPGRTALALSVAEPKFSTPDKPLVVSAPIIRALDKMASTVTTTLNDSQTKVELLPMIIGEGKYRLDLGTSIVEKGRSVGAVRTHGYLRDGEWVRCRLVDSAGGYQGYQFVVQLTLVKDQ